MIFVLDDDPAILTLVRSACLVNDWIVETFTSVDAFLGALDPDRAHVVLLDYQLAGETGLDALIGMHERHAPVPAILMSGVAKGEDVADAFKAGAVDFLRKPFDLEELHARVNAALARGEDQRERHRRYREIAQRWEQLSPRERQVVDLVADGCSNKEIGAKLGISQKTVEVHRSNASAKLRAKNVADLVRMVMTLRGT